MQWCSQRVRREIRSDPLLAKYIQIEKVFSGTYAARLVFINPLNLICFNYFRTEWSWRATTTGNNTKYILNPINISSLFSSFNCLVMPLTATGVLVANSFPSHLENMNANLSQQIEVWVWNPSAAWFYEGRTKHLYL